MNIKTFAISFMLICSASANADKSYYLQADVGMGGLDLPDNQLKGYMATHGNIGGIEKSDDKSNLVMRLGFGTYCGLEDVSLDCGFEGGYTMFPEKGYIINGAESNYANSAMSYTRRDLNFRFFFLFHLSKQTDLYAKLGLDYARQSLKVTGAAYKEVIDMSQDSEFMGGTSYSNTGTVPEVTFDLAYHFSDRMDLHGSYTRIFGRQPITVSKLYDAIQQSKPKEVNRLLDIASANFFTVGVSYSF